MASEVSRKYPESINRHLFSTLSTLALSLSLGTYSEGLDDPRERMVGIDLPLPYRCLAKGALHAAGDFEAAHNALETE